jgi:hypothetical protein
MRWIKRGWMMIPVVVAVVGVSCGDGGTAPTGANVQFVLGDIDLQAVRDTVVQISNTGGSAIGPIQLVPLPVRDSAGGVVSGPSLQVIPSDIATLNAGASVSAALSVVVPANTPNGDYQVGLEARSQNQLLASTLLRFQVTNGPSGPPANSVAITSGPTAFIRGDVVQFTAEVRDSAGAVLPNEPVQWSVGGFGLFDATGRFVAYGTGAIDIIAQSGTGADTLSVIVADRTLSGTFSTLGHGVVDSRTSDLWVHGGVLYSGTWNGGGGTFYAWSLANPDQPVKSDSLTIDASVVNDVKIRSDGTLGVITHEGSSDGLNGVSLLDLTVPEHPTIITRYTTGLEAGVHNAWLEGNFLYLVTDGSDPTTGGLRILDVSNPAAPTQVAQFYGGGSRFLHDVYLRDGLAFLSHWDQGLIILDVGNGVAGGSPANPVEVSRLQIPGYLVHNAWYWPAAGYVFLGDEINAPGLVLVIDVSDLRNPVEVASFSAIGEKPHNFWLDESRGILYAAWYSSGLRALDVSGPLMGELERQGRQIAQVMYDGGNTFTWAPQLDNGRIYLSDLRSGVWVVQGDF